MKANTEQTNSLEPQAPRNRPVSAHGLTEILEEHNQWLDSKGEAGIQANFSDLNLEGADLIDASLRDAIF